MDVTGLDKVLVFVAHVRLPKLAMAKVGAQAVVYIPAGRPPHKTGVPLTDAAHRLAMLRLALEHEPWARIWTDEIDRAAKTGQPTYTVDTLERLRKCVGPAMQMRLLIGADQLRLFDTWRDHDRITELAEPLVMIRPPDSRDSLLENLPPGLDRATWSARLIDLPTMDVSATQIRHRVAAGEPIDDVVHPAVAAYIARHRLYQ